MFLGEEIEASIGRCEADKGSELHKSGVAVDLPIQMRDVSLTQHVLGALSGGLLLHLFAQGVEIGVKFGQRPAVAVFGWVTLIEGAPLAVSGRGGVDGPDFSTAIANVMAAMKAGFFEVVEIFRFMA